MSVVKRYHLESRKTCYEISLKLTRNMFLRGGRPEAYSEPCQTSKMECFAKVVSQNAAS